MYHNFIVGFVYFFVPHLFKDLIGARETVNNEITIKGMSINRDNHKVIVDGEEIKLTPIEFDILYLLASNPGKVFSTDEIFEKVWNEKV